MSESVANKFDRVAGTPAERRYANLDFYMKRLIKILISWGRPLQPGHRVLELGCGDGFLSKPLVEYGLSYHGFDISPKMVAKANARIQEVGLEADFSVANIDEMVLSEPYDAIVSNMRSFFKYARDPLKVLKQLRPYVKKKLIVDLNPRKKISLQEGVHMLKDAGYSEIAWRPFFVPTSKHLPKSLLELLVICEYIPLLRKVPMQWKFEYFLKAAP